MGAGHSCKADMDEDAKKTIAKFRLKVISNLVTKRRLPPDKKESESILKKKASSEWDMPFSIRTDISQPAIRSWIRAYKQGGRSLESLYPTDLDQLEWMVEFLETDWRPEELKKNRDLIKKLYRGIRAYFGPPKDNLPAVMLDRPEDRNRYEPSDSPYRRKRPLFVEDLELLAEQYIPEYQKEIKKVLKWDEYKEKLRIDADREYLYHAPPLKQAPAPPEKLKDFLDKIAPGDLDPSYTLLFPLWENFYGLPQDAIATFKGLVSRVSDNSIVYCTGCDKVFVKMHGAQEFCSTRCNNYVCQMKSRFKAEERKMAKGYPLQHRFKLVAKQFIEGGTKVPLVRYVYLPLPRPEGEKPDEQKNLPVTTEKETYRAMIQELDAARERGAAYVIFVGEAWRPNTECKDSNDPKYWIEALIGRMYFADGGVLAVTADIIKSDEGTKTLLEDQVVYKRLPGWTAT